MKCKSYDKVYPIVLATNKKCVDCDTKLKGYRTVWWNGSLQRICPDCVSIYTLRKSLSLLTK